MSLSNAKAEIFSEVRIFGEPALFSPIRLDHNSVLGGYHVYELRHDDDPPSHTPIEIAKNILANHWGTIITSKHIDLTAAGYLKLKPGDLKYGAGWCKTLNEFMEKYPSQPANERGSQDVSRGII